MHLFSLPTPAPRLGLAAVSRHVPEALAVVALDVILALERVTLLAVPLALELLVLEGVTKASIAIFEAPVAVSTAPIALIGPTLLVLLLLLLAKRLNFLFLLLIPS